MLETQEKIRLLRKLLEKSAQVTVEDCDDPNFKGWKNLVERTFINIFGEDSTEFAHFNKLQFYYSTYSLVELDARYKHLKRFRESYKMLIESINQYIEELEEHVASSSEPTSHDLNANISKVFISHASKDAEIVEEVIEILETIGLDSDQIFCTSFDGYGIDLGEDFLSALKKELSSDCLVIFLLSKDFYESPVCLCEMGATWVLAKEHIPILVPPMGFSDINGVIPLTQGFKLSDPMKLNIFKEKMENVFSISSPLSISTWERKRDRIISRIEKLLN